MNQIQRKTHNDANHTTFSPVYERDVGVPQRNSWRSSLRKALSNNYITKRFSYASNNGYNPNVINEENIAKFNQPSRQYSPNVQTSNARHQIQNGYNDGQVFPVGRNEQEDVSSLSDLPMNNIRTNYHQTKMKRPVIVIFIYKSSFQCEF